MVIRRFQPHDHHIALRHILDMLIHVDMIEMEGTVAGIDLHAMFLHILIIAMRQEVHLLPAISQLAAVIAADGSHSDDSVLHICSLFWVHRYSFSKTKE